MKTITFIIPVYNGEKFINRCIKSCLMQACEDLSVEVIVIDDGSTDKSLSIIEEISENVDSVKTMSQTNAGVSAARNAGLEKSKGDYIMFVDADDYLTPNSIPILIKGMEAESIDVLSFGAIVEDEDCAYQHELSQHHTDDIISEKYSGPDYIRVNEGPYKKSEVSGAWGFIVNRNVLDSTNLKFKEGLPFGEDSLFFIELILQTKSIAFTKYKFYHYIQHPSSVMHSHHPIETIHKATLIRCLENRRILMNYREMIDSEIHDIIEGRLIAIAFSRLFLRMLKNNHETYYANCAIGDFKEKGLWPLPKLPTTHSPYTGIKAILYRLLSNEFCYKAAIRLRNYL